MNSPTSSGGAVDTAKDAARDAVDTVKDKAGDLVDQAKDAATDRLLQGKEQATGLLAGAADALHDTADALRERDNDAFARYADAAADQVAQFTDALRGKSVGELMDEAERFARRDPGLFLGGAFVLGIFGARFLKAATPQRSGARSGYSRAADGRYGAVGDAGTRRYASGTYDARVGGYGASNYGLGASRTTTPGTGTPGMTGRGGGTMGAGSLGAGETASGLPSGASRTESRTGTPHLPSADRSTTDLS